MKRRYSRYFVILILISLLATVTGVLALKDGFVTVSAICIMVTLVTFLGAVLAPDKDKYRKVRNLKTFDDLVFERHPMGKLLGVNLQQTKIKFENGKEISVIFGETFYSNGIDTYEVMNYETNDVKGYLTKEEVTDYMIKMQTS